MPSVQSIATAASSRSPPRRLSRLMPNPESRQNAAAPSRGENPKYAPSPTPPNEACAMPPPMMTMRRVTTYVPIIEQSTAASKAAIKAFRKNGLWMRE